MMRMIIVTTLAMLFIVHRLASPCFGQEPIPAQSQLAADQVADQVLEIRRSFESGVIVVRSELANFSSGTPEFQSRLFKC